MKATVHGAALAKPNCQSQCSDVSIPYPFGIGCDCNIDSKFSITCNSTFNPPRPFLGKFVLLNISLDGQLRILTEVTYDCYDRFGRSSYLRRSLTLDKFSINNTINKFTAIGCDTFALVRTFGGPSNYATGCLSTCTSTSDPVDGSCSGIGCCQASIPKEAWGYDISVNSFENHSKVLAENPCNYAFVAEDDNYTFSKSDLSGYVFQDRKFPFTLDWTIGNTTCSESKKDTIKFACKENSKCLDSVIGGYLCKCFDGFEGNPYLSNGCQGINECELDPCVSMSTCQNLPGSYNCPCPVGFEGDGRKDGTSCSPIKRSAFFYIALGCCLETEVPMLVYEFVTNGTLFDLIHNVAAGSVLPWETRLRIATETAAALSYLHSAASVPIIHRDIKLANILLDENYTAKIADFEASRFIPYDEAEIATVVQGTFGYLDPEYMRTSLLTEKSDVYSFGVVLIELLTGQKAVSFERSEEKRVLAMHFISLMKEDRLQEILDLRMLKDENVYHKLKEVAALARRCVRVKGEERPTMKEVAHELASLQAMTRHPLSTSNLEGEEPEWQSQPKGNRGHRKKFKFWPSLFNIKTKK
ncbi:hypothetical protein PTKIN_Ptkin01aG0017900 [Pterospermum kingtungense]